MIYCLGSVSPPFCSTWSSFTQLTPAAPSLLPLAPFWLWFLLPLRFKTSIPAALFMLSDYSGCSALVQLEAALLRYATFSRCWLVWVNWADNLLDLRLSSCILLSSDRKLNWCLPSRSTRPCPMLYGIPIYITWVNYAYISMVFSELFLFSPCFHVFGVPRFLG